MANGQNSSNVILSSLALDLALIMILPFSNYFAYLIVLLLVFVVPLIVSAFSPSAVQSLSERSQGGSSWSGLSRAMGGGSLCFLLIVTATAVFQESLVDEPLGVFALFYLVLLTIRMSGAGLACLFLSPVTLIMGKSNIDRASSISAFLSTLAAFAILKYLREENRESLMALDAGTPEQYLFLTIMIAVSFGYGLVWGGAIQYFIRRLKPST